VVEKSEDLTNWVAATGPFDLGSAGFVQFQDDAHSGIEFYRVKCGAQRSLNAIGSVVITCPSSPTNILMANPFNTPDNTVRGLLSNVPEGSGLYKLDEATQTYHANQFSLGRWSDETMTLRPGEGVFFSNSLAQPLTLLLTGEILQGELTNSLRLTNWAIRSSMVPQPGGITTTLGYGPDFGDQVTLYTNNTQLIYNFSEFGAQWFLNGEPSEPALAVGDAALIYSVSAKAWRQRYFVWP
jgi:hypothetical protein